MTAVAEKESTELVTVPSKETALDVFKAEQGLDPYLQTIRQELDAFLAEPPSLDTASGRKAYASMAHKIARSKTAVDNIGKELVADLKQLPKTIDAERKRWRDQLDAWRDEARGPLNEWEAAEEARKARHNDRIEHIRSFEEFDGLLAAGIEVQLANLEEIAVNDSLEEYEAEAHRAKDKAVKVLRAAIEAQKAREAEQADLERLRQEAIEREQKEREERIVREAEERARREAVQYVRRDAHDARVAKLEQERIELAAHVERLHMAWVDAKRCVSVVAFPNLYRVEQYQSLAKASIKKLESAFAEQPATNLTRRDKLQQAEALELAAEMVSNAGCAYKLVEHADDLRQQAEKQTPSDCELECGAYGAYCKCKAEAHQ